jgi:hypothetical protein
MNSEVLGAMQQEATATHCREQARESAPSTSGRNSAACFEASFRVRGGQYFFRKKHTNRLIPGGGNVRYVVAT